MNICPACLQPVRKNVIYCTHCGCQLIRTSLGATIPVKPTRIINQPIELPPPQHNGENISLLVRSPQGLVPLAISANRRLILGRTDPELHTVPDLDLTAFDAHELGVSRFHAAIDCGSRWPTLADLNSRNGTEVNGVRLKPYEAQRLQHEDVICLGKLVLYIHF